MGDMIYTDHVMEINKLIEHEHVGTSGYTEGSDVDHGDRVCLDKYRYHTHTGGSKKVYLPAYIGNWEDHTAADHVPEYFTGTSDRKIITKSANTYSGETYNTAWVATSGGFSGTLSIGQNCDKGTNPPGTLKIWNISRFYVYFNTSILSGETLISATLRVYGGALESETQGSLSLVVQNGQPTYPSLPCVVTDYNKALYSGNGGSILASEWVVGTWNDIELNDLSWVNQTGYTKLCLRTSDDIAGVDYDSLCPWNDEYHEGFQLGSGTLRLQVVY